MNKEIKTIEDVVKKTKCLNPDDLKNLSSDILKEMIEEIRRSVVRLKIKYWLTKNPDVKEELAGLGSDHFIFEDHREKLQKIHDALFYTRMDYQTIITLFRMRGESLEGYQNL